jgi:hypothetical protein
MHKAYLEDGLKLLEEAERLLCARDIFKGRVDEALERGLELGDVDVELEKVAVEGVFAVVQEVVWLLPDVVYDINEA